MRITTCWRTAALSAASSRFTPWRGIVPFTHLAREGRMTVTIGRRELLAALGGTAAAWPLAARAQQPERKRRVVFLHSSAENDPEVQARIAAFRQGLETLGWVENRNVQIEHRFSDGDFAQIQPHTAELVSSAPDLIVGSGTAVIMALKQATRSIPIVFNMVVDPVGQGLIVSLARPGGNVTASHSSIFQWSGNGWRCSRRSPPTSGGWD